MDTGWLLVGGAGVTGGLALVLVGAGIATAPLLLPVGALLAVVAYLAWAAGTSHIVASVYDGVDDPDRSIADGRTGRPEDRVDPDGNWRSTAADGGRTAGPDAGATGGGPGAGAGVGPDDEPIWDATERDRAGGWDDWGADRQWNGFRRGHNDRTGGTDATRRGPDRSGRRTARDDDRTGDRRGRRRRERTETGRQQRAHGGESSRRSRRGDRRRRGRTRRRDGQARRARDLLEVDPDATEETLRTAYRERVKEVHPDRGGDPERFKRVQWAYEYLTECGD